MELYKTLLIIIFITIFSFNYNVLIPVFAKTVLGLKEQGFGVLLSSLGIGSLIGALSAPVLSGKEPRPHNLVYSSLLIGISLLCVSSSTNIYTTCFFIACCGVFNLWFFTAANSILQLNSQDSYRGRVMGVYSVAFAGTMPIGNFIVGYSAENLGANRTFAYAGIIVSFTMVVLILNKFLRKRRIS